MRDFSRIDLSYINQWLQTLCSFPMRFLQYFTCKSMVTNLMFVPNAVSGVFRMHISGYTPHGRCPCDLCSISHVKQWLQTLSSYP